MSNRRLTLKERSWCGEQNEQRHSSGVTLRVRKWCGVEWLDCKDEGG